MTGDVTEALVGFARTLRHAGVAATPDRVQTMVAALDVLGPAAVYWSGRLTLCAEPDDLPRYDAVFAAYFDDGADERTRQRPERQAVPRLAAPSVAGRGDHRCRDDRGQARAGCSGGRRTDRPAQAHR